MTKPLIKKSAKALKMRIYITKLSVKIVGQSFIAAADAKPIILISIIVY